jgi:hypothetical protein
VHKVQHKHTKKRLEGILYSLEHTFSWCSQCRTEHCLVPRLQPSANWPLSGFLSARPLKFTGLSGEPKEQRSTSPNSRLRWLHRSQYCANCSVVSRAEVRSQSAKSKSTRLSDVPPDYPVPQEDRRLQRSTTPNPNSRLTWNSPDSEQCSVRCTTELSGVPIDNNDWNSVWGYKYPPTTTIQTIQAFQLSHSILEQKYWKGNVPLGHF